MTTMGEEEEGKGVSDYDIDRETPGDGITSGMDFEEKTGDIEEEEPLTQTDSWKVIRAFFAEKGWVQGLFVKSPWGVGFFPSIFN